MQTLDFVDALGSGWYWFCVLITASVMFASVFLHYEALERLNFGMPHWRLKPRSRILLMIMVILAVHIAEIWVFAAGIYVAVQFPEMGAVSGTPALGFLDAVYLSATTFTTVGYGDIVPTGAVRLILGTEALTGFVLITWSASFTYLEMQRYWRAR